MIKRFLMIFASLIMISQIAITANASDEYGDYTLDRVIDEANVLSDEEEQSLETQISTLINDYNQDCLILIVNDYKQEMKISGGIDNFGDNYYNTMGYGFGERKSGTIFVVSTETREWWFKSYGETSVALTKGYGLEWMEYKVIDELSDDKYYECFDQFAEYTYDFVKEKEENTPYGFFHPKLDSEPYLAKLRKRLIIIVLLVVAVMTFVAVFLLRSMRTVKRQTNATQYRERGSFRLDIKKDEFIGSVEKTDALGIIGKILLGLLAILAAGASSKSGGRGGRY